MIKYLWNDKAQTTYLGKLGVSIGFVGIGLVGLWRLYVPVGIAVAIDYLIRKHL